MGHPIQIGSKILPGANCYLFDQDNNVNLDAVGFIWVVILNVIALKALSAVNS